MDITPYGVQYDQISNLNFPSSQSNGVPPVKPIVKSKKKRDASRIRKPPEAPKRFKSSYILFFMAKQKEIKEELGEGVSVGEVSKRSSEKWKSLSPEERSIWDKKADEDKKRYEMEKEKYTGPWQVPWKRVKKNPKAPKRPMSAFLFYSQDKRRVIKEANPNMRNTEISRVLGDMWKNAPPEERAPHIEREASEREKYKVDMAKWKEEEVVRRREMAIHERIHQDETESEQKSHSKVNHQSSSPSPDYSHEMHSPLPLNVHNQGHSSSPLPIHGYYAPQTDFYTSHTYGGTSQFTPYGTYQHSQPHPAHKAAYLPHPEYRPRHYSQYHLDYPSASRSDCVDESGRGVQCISPRSALYRSYYSTTATTNGYNEDNPVISDPSDDYPPP